jgi:hypothetical protein
MHNPATYDPILGLMKSMSRMVPERWDKHDKHNVNPSHKAPGSENRRLLI